MHSPRLVLIAAAVSDHHRSDWEWLKWLPHNRHPHASDDVGSTRMVYGSPAAAKKALSGITTDPAAPQWWSSSTMTSSVVIVGDRECHRRHHPVDNPERDEDSSSAGALRPRAGQNEVVVAVIRR